MNEMMPLVRLLEGKSARKRKHAILGHLDSCGVPYELHQYWEWFVPRQNIIVTKAGQSNRQILLLSHYDTYHRSPGANDNASGVAVALMAISSLSSQPTHCTIKAIAFDNEERTLLRPRPCLGSRRYVAHYGVGNIAGVFCLELCGHGDIVVIWPVLDSDRSSRLLAAASDAFLANNIPHEFIARLPGFTSDFMPFRKAGVTEAFCFTAAPGSERDELLQLFFAPFIGQLFTIGIPQLFGFTSHLPKMIRYYHTKNDKAEHLSEDSLQMMAEALCKAILAYDDRVKQSET